jgi:cell division topological specificity factor
VSIFNYFLKKEEKSSASVAKERLQIIVAHERNKRHQPDYLPRMQQEIINVIRKYVNIDDDQVTVQVENTDARSVLELNITLPE